MRKLYKTLGIILVFAPINVVLLAGIIWGDSKTKTVGLTLYGIVAIIVLVHLGLWLYEKGADL